TKGIYSDGGAIADMAQNGSNITVVASDGIRANTNMTLIRDVRAELDPTQVHTVEGTPTSGANSHEVLVGSDYRDYLQMRGGDDTVYGEGGDDYLFGGGGVDRPGQVVREPGRPRDQGAIAEERHRDRQ
ncbi:MAG: hypothetical protein ABMB14_28775, partial [Myxococcota bacterium]